MINTQKELNFAMIFLMYKKHWRVGAALFAGFLFLGVMFYFLFVPYTATVRVLVNDPQNSNLQAFSNQYFGLSKTVQEGRKGNSLLNRQLEYLKTKSFLETFLKTIDKRSQSKEISLAEIKGYEKLKKHYLENSNKDHLLQTLNSWVEFKLSSDFEITLKASHTSKEINLFLVNTLALAVKESLTEKENEEILKVESFMQQEKLNVDDKIADMNKQLMVLQKESGQSLALMSQEKIDQYLSELLIRSNEIKLKISENNKTIEYLSQGRKDFKDSALYGVGGKIEALKVENGMMKAKLQQTLKSMEQMKLQTQNLPLLRKQVEDLRTKSEIELNRYKELTQILSKVEAQKLTLPMRYEVVDAASLETIKAKFGFIYIFGFVVMLSQALFALYVYIQNKRRWASRKSRALEDVAVLLKRDPPAVSFQ